YSWTFGDGQVATGVTASHTYPGSSPTYSVTLTITNNDNVASSASKSVTAYSDKVTFTYNCSGLTCAFDASASRNHAGIASFSWNFGDGQTAAGATPSHTYSD